MNSPIPTRDASLLPWLQNFCVKFPAHASTLGCTLPQMAAANDADPDGDHLPNIMEHVMGRDPNSRLGVGSNVPLELTSRGTSNSLLAHMVLLNTYDNKVRLTIQYSTTLASWTTLATRTGTGAWSVTPFSTTALAGGRTRFEFNTAAFPILTPKYYLRVKAEELP